MATASHTMESVPKSTDTATELLWQDALRLLKATNNEVLLPTNVRDMIGQGNVNRIKTRLSALLGAPVVGFIDESIDAFRLMRTPAFSGSTVSVASHDLISSTPKRLPIRASMDANERPSKGAKIPRPPNAFILYRQHHHPKIKEAYPDFQNNDISIMLGKQWKSEPDEVRAHYKSLADEQKQKHAEEHPDYQYTPRRPCEKKRRASSRQYAKHSKAAAAAGVASAGAGRMDVQNQGVPESPISMTSAATLSSVPTPGSVQGIGGEAMTPAFSNTNVYLGPNDLQDEQFSFDTSAFDLMVEELRNGQNQDFVMPMTPVEQTAVNSLDFSEFITDCF